MSFCLAYSSLDHIQAIYISFNLTSCNMLCTVNCCLFGLFVFACPQRKQHYMHLIKDKNWPILYLAFFPIKKQTIETVFEGTLWPRSHTTSCIWVLNAVTWYTYLHEWQPYYITVHTHTCTFSICPCQSHKLQCERSLCQCWAFDLRSCSYSKSAQRQYISVV